jgi:hydrogenase small subunit
VSLLNSAHPGFRDIALGQVLPGVHVSIKFHPTLMAAQGAGALGVLDGLSEKGFVLALEGSLPDDERFCAAGCRDGREVPVKEQFLSLAPKAALVLAVGTCSSFGGIPAGAPNPGAYRSAESVMAEHGIRTPLVNVPGCPPHPDWVTKTLLDYVMAGRDASALALDPLKRPLGIYGQVIHENCPRRAYFDEGKFAEKPGDPECLHKVGCKGPITYADCPLREWNNSINWCIKAGAPCQGCTQPEFIDLTTPIYVELAEDRMPKVGEQVAAGGRHE